MATLKYRLNRKNASGTYDTIHYETSSNIVMRPSGRTVEQDLADFLPRSQDTDDVPQSLTQGQMSIALSKVFAKLGGGTVCNLVYTHPSDKQCNYSPDLSGYATKSELSKLEQKIALGYIGFSSPVLGARIRIGGFDYVIVHITTSIVYAIIEVCPSLTKFGTSPTYSGSTIAALCTTWYNNNVPSDLKSAGVFVNVVTEGVTSPCFIPTYNQFNGGFSYFTNNDRRIASAYVNANSASSYNGYYYWTSTAYSSSYVWTVTNNGGFGNDSPAGSGGFRPALAISRSAFS